jgi:hypothetical protein
MDHLRSEKKPVYETLWLAKNQDMADRYELLEDQLKNARERYALMPSMVDVLAEVNRLEGELETLRKEIRKPANSFKFVFQSIGPKKYDKLQDEHPLSEENRKKLEERGLDPNMIPFDANQFAPALVAVSCIEPKMTLEFVKDEIQNCEDGSWSTGEFGQLYNAAIKANVRIRNINLGKEFKQTRNSTKS